MLDRRIIASLAGFIAQLDSVRDDLRTSISHSRRTIAESRELMAQVNAVLERDKIIGRP
jgi:hypothetical protein